MAGFDTGLNALNLASALVSLAGENIANADTPGYHVRRASVVPVVGSSTGGLWLGAGATIEDVTRVRSELIEKALLEHVQAKEKFEAEVETLTHVELLFSEPSDAGLDARLGEFFDSVELLAADPDDPTLRDQVVQKGQALCNMFNQLASNLDDVADDLAESMDLAVNDVNALTERIADLNGRIRSIETSGTSAPSLKDARDQLVTELAELVEVDLHETEYGVVNVSCRGTLLVSGDHSTAVTSALTDDGWVLRCEGSVGHRIEINEGRLGGLMTLANELIPRFRTELDDLADAVRRSVNTVHTTALGLSGRFHALNGLNGLTGTDPFYAQGYGVPAGTNEKLVINVEDEATGEVTQYEIVLDTTQATDAFLTDLSDSINSTVGHVTANVTGGRFSLSADDGYAFGFATPYDPNPAEPGDISGADPTSPTVLGAYTGEQDLVYEVSFLDSGEVGTDTIDIQVNVRDEGGSLLYTLAREIDDGYTAGDVLLLDNGLKVTLSQGDVVAGDAFSFAAHATMDSAGVLDALGLNCLFSGLGAADIEVADRIVQDPGQLAGSLHPAAGDNNRFLDLAAVRSQNVADEGSTTLSGLYQKLVGGIATSKNTRSVQLNNQEVLVQGLSNSRDSVSGVNVNDEMIRMMEARTIYQGALKYISLLDSMLSDLVNLL